MYFLKSQLFRSLILLTLALLIVGSIELAPAQTVLAGSNGQQIRAYIQCNLAPVMLELKIVGLNQNSNQVTYDAFPNSKDVTTKGWYWKSPPPANTPVQISYRYRIPGWKSDTWAGISAVIPVSSNQDPYPVQLDKGLVCGSP